MWLQKIRHRGDSFLHCGNSRNEGGAGMQEACRVKENEFKVIRVSEQSIYLGRKHFCNHGEVTCTWILQIK